MDASVRCVVLCWPVIDPLGRYRYALKLREAGTSKWADQVVPHHLGFWADEAAMAEGSPLLALERGEPVGRIPVLYLQGTKDGAHPRELLDRFVAAYRKAGASVELHLFPDMTEAFINNEPGLPQSIEAVGRIISFVHKEIGAPAGR